MAVKVQRSGGSATGLPSKKTSMREPGLDEMIQRNASRLSATTDLSAAVSATEITFVVVPTPSGPEKIRP